MKLIKSCLMFFVILSFSTTSFAEGFSDEQITNFKNLGKRFSICHGVFRAASEFMTATKNQKLADTYKITGQGALSSAQIMYAFAFQNKKEPALKNYNDLIMKEANAGYVTMRSHFQTSNKPESAKQIEVLISGCSELNKLQANLVNNLKSKLNAK